MSEAQMSVPAPMVRAFIARACIDQALLADAARDAGLSVAALISAAEPVVGERFSALYRGIVVRMDDEMPGMFSRPLRQGSLKFLCQALLDAPSVQVALLRVVRFARLMLDDFSLELTAGPLGARLSLRPHAPHGRCRALGQQFLLKLLHGLLCWLSGRSVAMAGVAFAFPGAAFVSPHLFPGPFRFDDPASGFAFEPALLGLPVRRSRRELESFLVRAPSTWLTSEPAEPSLRDRVRGQLALRLNEPPGVAEIARALHLSARTLTRRLDAEGTSFQVLKDELRRELAMELLTRTRAPVAAIAAELGYGDPNSLYRAFRGWTGTTPDAWRRRTVPPGD